MNTKTILAFGLLPVSKGGKNLSGIGLAIWNLHNEQNKLSNDFSIVYGAIDFRKRYKKTDSLDVFGYHLKSMIFFFISRPDLFFSTIYKCFSQRKKLKISFKSLFIYLSFFEYLFHKTSPYAIQTHGAEHSIAFGLSKNYQRCKKILRIHGLAGIEEYSEYEKSRRIMETKMSNLKFDLLTCLTSDVLEKWKTFYSALSYPSYTVLNGYDESLFFYTNPKRESVKKINLITISVINENKGQLRVVEALSEINNKEFFKYTMIGYGKESIINNIKSFANENGVNIEILGHLPQEKLRERIGEADYMILPSRFEGFGMGLIESIACGTPVIIPKDLPLAIEPNILNNKNSVFIDSYHSKSIMCGLEKAKDLKFDRKEVSSTVSHLVWKNAAIMQNELIERFIL